MSNVSQETAHTVNGVPGRLYARHAWDDARFSAQKWISEGRPYPEGGWGRNARLHAEIRFDDECRNGHNSFSLTAKISNAARRDDNGTIGCAHGAIGEIFPELAPFIRWHHMATDGPMHYPANPLYLAGDRDCWGRRAGEVSASTAALVFGEFPIPFKLKAGFAKWIGETLAADMDRDGLAFQLTPIAVAHREAGKPGAFQFAPKYQFAGQPPLPWHECPFDSEPEAEAFAAALLDHSPRLIQIPTAWSDGKARELDAARRAAVWADATDAELMQEPDELRAALMARLPALVAEFRREIEAAGFAWSPADLKGA